MKAESSGSGIGRRRSAFSSKNAFQAFLREPGAARLLRERPRLDLLLDDFEALGRLPKDSLGQAYRRLALRDEISVTGLVEGEQALPDEAERCPDPVRKWFRARGVATHDLLHVLTGYDRDERGEVQLLAFSEAINPKRVFRVGLMLGLLGSPIRGWPGRLRDIVRGWRRGRGARIPRALDWEGLLALPLDDARAVLHIQTSGPARSR